MLRTRNIDQNSQEIQWYQNRVWNQELCTTLYMHICDYRWNQTVRQQNNQALLQQTATKTEDYLNVMQ